MENSSRFFANTACEYYPCHETEKELKESIESILLQNYSNFEFIIVNDNPLNDRLKKVLDAYQLDDRRIKIINNETNLGLAKSLNKALACSRGKYIARMDADDISLLNRFEKEVEYLESHKDCDVVSTNRDDIDENSNIIRKATAIIVEDVAIPKILKYGSIITHPSIMIKAEVIKALKGYRPFKSSQDYDLWLRMVSKGYKFHILPQVLIKYRIRQNSITKSNYARSYFCHKYIRQLFFEREINNGSDSFSEEYLSNIFYLPTSKTELINDQYRLIMTFSENKYQPLLIVKLLLGIIQNKDCFINFKNMFLAKLLITYNKVKTCAE